MEYGLRGWMGGGVSCDAGIQAQSVPFHFHNNPETSKKPSEEHQCPGSQPWKGEKTSRVYPGTLGKAIWNTAPRQTFFSAKMEKDAPANQIRGDSTTELTTQPRGRWDRNLPAIQPGLQRSLLPAVFWQRRSKASLSAGEGMVPIPGCWSSGTGWRAGLCSCNPPRFHGWGALPAGGTSGCVSLWLGTPP